MCWKGVTKSRQGLPTSVCCLLTDHTIAFRGFPHWEGLSGLRVLRLIAIPAPQQAPRRPQRTPQDEPHGTIGTSNWQEGGSKGRARARQKGDNGCRVACERGLTDRPSDASTAAGRGGQHAARTRPGCPPPPRTPRCRQRGARPPCRPQPPRGLEVRVWPPGDAPASRRVSHATPRQLALPGRVKGVCGGE